MKALFGHFLITLKLNYRSWKPLVYGYLLPVIFLVGFATVFRAGQPRLLEQMGQILTITILGSTCLGMATALVAEREQGLWRRYQLLPIPVNRLLLSVMAVRILIVWLAVGLQLILARLIYGTPFPAHILVFQLFLLLVVFAFLGIGLILTALAREVPSVQALGQCLFLPMILIGGVGIPLFALPQWAKAVASCMPGRYAVELLQSCYHTSLPDTAAFAFPALALFGIGCAAMLAAFKMMRWDPQQRLSPHALSWVAVALFAWVGVGMVAVRLDRVESSIPVAATSFSTIDASHLASIDFEQLPEDFGFYTPLAPPLKNTRLTHRMQELKPRLQDWNPGKVNDPAQAVLNHLCVAAIADIYQDPSEAVIARMVFDQLQSNFEPEQLEKSLAWVIFNPDKGHLLTSVPELGFSQAVDPGIARERCDWYARKFLGRLLGVIPENSR